MIFLGIGKNISHYKNNYKEQFYATLEPFGLVSNTKGIIKVMWHFHFLVVTSVKMQLLFTIIIFFPSSNTRAIKEYLF